MNNHDCTDAMFGAPVHPFRGTGFIECTDIPVVWLRHKAQADKLLHATNTDACFLEADTRAIALEWIHEVCYKFDDNGDVLMRTVTIFDTFVCSGSYVRRGNLQCCAMAALQLSCKVDAEAYSYKLFEQLANNLYEREDFVRMELLIARKLCFQTQPPIATHSLVYLMLLLGFDMDDVVSVLNETETWMQEMVIASILHPTKLAAACVYRYYRDRDTVYAMKLVALIVVATGHSRVAIVSCANQCPPQLSRRPPSRC
jgi:hypothetical protein